MPGSEGRDLLRELGGQSQPGCRASRTRASIHIASTGTSGRAGEESAQLHK